MTPQEQDMLNDLVRKINGAPLQDKDDDAERLLNSGLGRNPDALYVMAQTILVQNIALEQAKRQMSTLQQGGAQAKPKSFLGSLFGHDNPQPQAPPPPQQSYQTVQYAPQGGQQYAPAASGQPSFLRSAATTAAGVAAGALAFQGVESLLHGGLGGGGGFGGEGFGGGYGDAPREEIVNNYYGDSGGNDAGSGYDAGSGDVGAQDTSYDDFSDGGGDFGGDDTNFS